LSGGAVTVSSNSASTPTLSNTSFALNDVFTIVVNLNGSQFASASANITVEY